ncbi:hypothetical protein ADIMK_0121 [Marinobacterium lacunae]|uniref:Uncharacterized protein n=1 Tax=Marinobacterium lacunae TaxID=1232683 RepID=A0A081G494_9GAMM|nr:hypothetical protein [Marinobacterium lacunae]KEA65599.1 hypothetical protein ADIMK_0121 [Marinobacterium lacunae]
MKTLDSKAQLAVSALLGLIVLHTMMLVALFTHAALSPPDFVGPLNAAVIALQLMAILLIYCNNQQRYTWVLLAAVVSIPGVGPHKFLLEPDALQLSPVILSGTLFILMLTRYAIWTDRQRVSTAGN